MLAAGCSFTGSGTQANPDAPPIDGPDASGPVDVLDAVPDDTPDAPCPAWTYVPTNWEPCQLRAAIHVDFVANAAVIDGDSLIGSNSATEIDPGNGAPKVALVHLDELSVPTGAALTVIGSRAVILAVDGPVTIGGTIFISTNAGGNGACAGGVGGLTAALTGGAGGGGGAGGAANGGDGSDGSGLTPGAHGAHGNKRNQGGDITPLIGGCNGGAGGISLATPGGAGGIGGGALQISGKTTITTTGALVSAVGLGGKGGTSNAGGGGGGGGGAIFFEASTVTVTDSVVCADGGSGGQGGGTSTGANGTVSACNGTAAMTANLAMGGGNGGNGGTDTNPTNGGSSAGAEGGGGGGGAGGFVRFLGHTTPATRTGGTITPAAKLN